MANLHLSCKLCSHRVLAHDKSAKCQTCYSPWHANCLPCYSQADFEYASDPNSNWTCPHCLSQLFPFNTIENNDSFRQAVTNPINLSIDIESLESMIYDPFEPSNDDGEGSLSDIDPDLNFLGSIRGNALKILNITTLANKWTS